MRVWSGDAGGTHNRKSWRTCIKRELGDNGCDREVSIMRRGNGTGERKLTDGGVKDRAL